jgi:two-component system cell cycle sensor histidine kinase/response regulator CckA
MPDSDCDTDLRSQDMREGKESFWDILPIRKRKIRKQWDPPPILKGESRMSAERQQPERVFKQHSLLLEHIPDAVYVSDAEGQIVYANAAASRQTGISREALIGKMVWEIDEAFNPRDYAPLFSRLPEAGTLTLRSVHRRKGGTSFPIEISLSKLTHEGSAMLCGIVRDMTEHDAREISLKRTQLSVDSAPIGIFWISPEGNFIYVNHKAAENLGYSREELLRMSVAHISPSYSLDTRLTQWSSFKEKRATQFESVHRRKDGSVFPVRIYSYYLNFMGQEMEVAEVEDITESLRREERISLLGRMLDEAPASITIHDIEGRFLYANRIAYTSHGFKSPEEYLSMNLHDIDTPESEGRIAERMQQIMNTGEARFEVAHRRKNGTLLPLEVMAKTIEWHGQPAILSVAVDITERKKSEEALREGEQRLQSVFRSVPVGIGVVVNRVFQQVNQRVCDICGYSESELLGRSSRMLYPDDEEYERVGGVKYEQIRQKGIGTVETRWKRKDGTILRVLLSSSPIDMQDLQKGVTFTVLDITARHLLEEELRQAQKMESIGRLAGGVAHDFNNMLNVILGHAGLMLEEIPADSPLRADLKEIHAAAERSANLTRQLLAFARKQTVSPRILDLNETVSATLKMLSRLIGEDIELIWRPGSTLWPVKIDPSQIDQILANLCVNARDAISDVGRIAIETANCEVDETFCALHPGSRVGSFVRLAVRDTGCGMSRETLSHIFEPFFTTKSVGKGTGLGLATVYGAVQQNNGFILIDSEPGQGSTFSIYLPRHSEKAADAQAPVRGTVPQGQETILLVEDEPAILNLTRRVLERLGYIVLTAATPGEALRLAREYDARIDLLITDVVMPEMNGRDLAKSVLNLYPNMKRLFMSGYTADVIAHHGVVEEGVHFIQKPFTVETLGEKVRNVLEREST